MYQIVDDRGTGKTSRLLLLAKETDAIVVCSDPNKMRHKAYDYGLTGIDFISYDDFLHMTPPTNATNGYLIDDLDIMLNTRMNVIGYTISKDN